MGKLDNYLHTKLKEKAKEQLESTFKRVAASILEPPVPPPAPATKKD